MNLRISLLSWAGLLCFVSCSEAGPTGPTGACTSAKTPPNLLENASFDCTEVTDAWEAAFGSTFNIVAGGRTGMAGQITVTELGGRVVYAKEFALNAGTKSYCVTAWVKGTAPQMRMRVVRDFGGSASEETMSAPVTADWSQVPVIKAGNLNAPRLQLVFEAQTNRTDGLNAKVGDTLLIDDVDLWETTGNCQTTR